MFFNTKEPYDIAKKITKGSDLHHDLVSHVYLIMRDKVGIESKRNYFAMCCWIEWTKPNSSFNRKYKPFYTTEIIEELIEDIEHEETPNKYKKFLREYIAKEGKTNEDWFKKQIAKFTLIGMTQTEIQERYGIDQRYVSKTLEEFRKDVRNSYTKHCNSKDIDNL